MVKRIIPLLILLFIVTAYARADVTGLEASTMGVRTATFDTSLTQEERRANWFALRAAITEASKPENGNRLKLGDGPRIPVETPPDQLNIKISRNLTIEGNTTISLTAASYGGPGLDSPNYDWCLFYLTPVYNYKVHIRPGVKLQGPMTSPAPIWDGIPKALPTAIIMGAAWAPDVKRELVIDDVDISGFCNGIDIRGDSDPAPVNAFTTVRLHRGKIRAYCIGVSAWGRNKRLELDGVDIEAGDIYPGDPAMASGFGMPVYKHNAVEIIARFCIFTSTYGRAAVKDAGVRSEGGAAVSMYTNCIFDTRLRSGYGYGLEYDKFNTNVQLTGCYFGPNLRTGLGIFGSISTTNCVFRSRFGYETLGDKTGERPVITSNKDRFYCEAVWNSQLLENAELTFDQPTVWPRNGGTPFSLPNHPMANTMTMTLLRPRIVGACSSAFECRGGVWEIEQPRLEGPFARGMLFDGPVLEGASAIIRGGRFPLDQLWYHGATPEAKARVTFLP